MKNLLINVLFISTLSLRSQITLENSYPSPASNSNISFTRLTNAGDKFWIMDPLGKTLKLYDLNHSLWKTVNLPITTGQAISNVINVSDNLFDTDAKVEVMYVCAGTNYELKIINETGSVLKSLRTFYAYLANTTSGWKLMAAIDSLNKPFAKQWLEVYSLPGNQPALSIINSGTDPLTVLSSPMPNPSANKTIIGYQLPAGTMQDQLVIYDLTGKEVKRYSVDYNFNTLELNTQELPSGTYLYNLLASPNSGKKLVVVK